MTSRSDSFSVARRSIGLAALLVLVACVEQAPDLTQAERDQLRESILREAPHPQHAVDIDFDGRVKLLGYDVETESATPGQPFTITWYWQVERPLDSGWQLFTHLVDGNGTNRVNQDGEGVVRQIYQPGRWRQGEFIRDQQRITLPADWNSDRVVFFLGLWNGPHRLAITRGPHDSENRARAAEVRVGTQAAAAPPATAQPPAMEATFAATAPAIDGRLDEVVWTSTRGSGAFVNTLSGGPANLGASVKVAWDARNLYVGFDVADTHLRSTFTRRDDHLWEQDAVEIMVDPDGDGRNYFELQVSPSGQAFDTRYDSRRVPQPIGHDDWNSTIQARVTARGTVNDEGADQGYVTEIAIPWTSFVDLEGRPSSAPAAGSTWRFNFYAMDENGPKASGWSPTLEGDFHVPARFGRVTFAPGAATTAAAALTGERPSLTPEAAAALQEALRNHGSAQQVSPRVERAARERTAALRGPATAGQPAAARPAAP